jgi:hypothetical protein
MKRLAARDFEDILQVLSAYLFYAFDSLITFVSALFPCSRDCFPSSMMRLCSPFFTDSRNGMRLSNSDSTRTLRSPFLTKRSRNCHRGYETFETLLALPSTLWNYPKKEQLGKVKPPNALKQIVRLQNRAGLGSKRSICPPISFMRWVIM